MLQRYSWLLLDFLSDTNHYTRENLTSLYKIMGIIE